MSNTFRILARELAVEEIETVTGAYTGPGDDGSSDQLADAGSGCTSPDDAHVFLQLQ